MDEEKLKKKFKILIKDKSPKKKTMKNTINAFIIGGSICVVGDFIGYLYELIGIQKDVVPVFVSVTMIFLGALLTGLGIYDKIANIAGAGTVVPITGFSNAIVASAIEFKKEGFVFGVGGKMFTVAGPVLVYGIGSSIILGIVYYVVMLF